MTHSPDSLPVPITDIQGFPHLMLKEIWEQPDVVQICLETYFSLLSDPAALNLPAHLYQNIAHIHILASGTSRHAGLIAQYWFEQITGIPTRVRSASEFLAAPLPLTPGTLTIAITQSGETADTLTAIKQQKLAYADRGEPSRILGVTNQPLSTLTTLVDHTLLTLAGVEIGVAATKTFTTQLMVLLSLGLNLAQQRHTVSEAWLHSLLTEVRSLPHHIATILMQQDSTIKTIAQHLTSMRNCIVLGQGVNRAIALEGALKLKETTYIHAEGYAAGEFLHGPIALLDETVPVIAIAPLDSVQPQVLATLRRVKFHHVPAIGITTANSDTHQIFDHQIVLPSINALLSPLLTVIPLQLLAYHTAVQKGLNIDRPRHITKTLT